MEQAGASVALVTRDGAKSSRDLVGVVTDRDIGRVSRSLVGLLPFCAATVFAPHHTQRHPEMAAHFQRFLGTRPELTAKIHDPLKPGAGDRRLTAILNETRLRRVKGVNLLEKPFNPETLLRRVRAMIDAK